MQLSEEIKQRHLTFYEEKYGSIDAAFWAAMTHQLSPEETTNFEVKFYSTSRCMRAAVWGLTNQYGSAKKAVGLYETDQLNQHRDLQVIHVIESFLLYPNGPFHIHLGVK